MSLISLDYTLTIEIQVQKLENFVVFAGISSNEHYKSTFLIEANY